MSSTITQQIRELQNLAVAELATRYEALYGAAPRVRNKAFLQRKIAWKIQEREIGGFSGRAERKLEELIADIKLPISAPDPRRQRRRRNNKSNNEPMVGTTLIRKWRGQEIRVEVRGEREFEWNGTIYKSLTATARAITDSNWNGRLFFRLSSRRRHA